MKDILISVLLFAIITLAGKSIHLKQLYAEDTRYEIDVLSNGQVDVYSIDDRGRYTHLDIYYTEEFVDKIRGDSTTIKPLTE